jgi:PIN domain nuclease of toxin-antitoxin system
MEDSARDLRLQQVNVDFAIALEAYSLPDSFHRDPADRVLVATARTYQATLLTADDWILAYKHARTEDCRR